MEQIIPGLPELINAIVSIFWHLFVVIILIIFYKPIRYELLPKLSGFKAMGDEPMEGQRFLEQFYKFNKATFIFAVITS